MSSSSSESSSSSSDHQSSEELPSRTASSNAESNVSEKHDRTMAFLTKRKDRSVGQASQLNTEEENSTNASQQEPSESTGEEENTTGTSGDVAAEALIDEDDPETWLATWNAPKKKKGNEEGSKKTRPAKISGKSLSTQQTIEAVFPWIANNPHLLEIKIPTENERPWTCPEGWTCLYEAFFSYCGLWFPLPKLFTDFCRARHIAHSQLSTSAVRYMVGLMVIGNELGIDISRRFFDSLVSMGRNPTLVGTHYVSLKNKIIVGEPSKAQNWQSYYFFVKVTENSVADTELVCRTKWRRIPGRNSFLSN